MPQKKLNAHNSYIKYPATIMLSIIFFTAYRIIVNLISSRGWTLRLIARKKKLSMRLFLSFVYVAHHAYDYNFIIKEEIPLGDLFDNDQSIKENWVDNKEPQMHSVFHRLSQ